MRATKTAKQRLLRLAALSQRSQLAGALLIDATNQRSFALRPPGLWSSGLSRQNRNLIKIARRAGRCVRLQRGTCSRQPNRERACCVSAFDEVNMRAASKEQKLRRDIVPGPMPGAAEAGFTEIRARPAV